MKIWVTRNTTGELHAGGLERCRVWFTKPVFKYYDARPLHVQADELPWHLNPMEGLGTWGWSPSYERGCWTDISFGQFFGYGDKRENGHVPGLAEYVWKKLCEHYGNTEFPHGWYAYEKEGKCRQEDFLLEIDLNIRMSKKNV